jgi:hypothetical protein
LLLTLIGAVAPNLRLIAVQQIRYHLAVMNIGGGDLDRVDNPLLAIDANMAASNRARSAGKFRPRSEARTGSGCCSRSTRGGDVTLQGLADGLAERGLKVDYRTVWNFVHREGQSFKKNGVWR